MPLNFGGITDVSCKAKLISLSSPNPGALTPSANLTPTSGVKGASLNTDGYDTDDVANIVSVSKSIDKIPSHEARTEALCSVSTFAVRQRAKHHSVLKAKSP